MVAWNNFGPVSIFHPTSKSDLLLSRRRGRPRADLRTAGANGAADTPSGGRVGRGKICGGAGEKLLRFPPPGVACGGETCGGRGPRQGHCARRQGGRRADQRAERRNQAARARVCRRRGGARGGGAPRGRVGESAGGQERASAGAQRRVSGPVRRDPDPSGGPAVARDASRPAAGVRRGTQNWAPRRGPVELLEYFLQASSSWDGTTRVHRRERHTARLGRRSGPHCSDGRRAGPAAGRSAAPVLGSPPGASQARFGTSSPFACGKNAVLRLRFPLE
jgi:hypothetical protein